MLEEVCHCGRAWQFQNPMPGLGSVSVSVSASNFQIRCNEQAPVEHFLVCGLVMVFPHSNRTVTKSLPKLLLVIVFSHSSGNPK